jgi:hypothetical protein
VGDSLRDANLVKARILGVPEEEAGSIFGRDLLQVRMHKPNIFTLIHMLITHQACLPALTFARLGRFRAGAAVVRRRGHGDNRTTWRHINLAPHHLRNYVNNVHHTDHQ